MVCLGDTEDESNVDLKNLALHYTGPSNLVDNVQNWIGTGSAEDSFKSDDVDSTSDT